MEPNDLATRQSGVARRPASADLAGTADIRHGNG
jgi:hypothetical protein